MERTYIKYIADYINQKENGIPIYTAEVAQAVAKQYKIDITQAKKVVNVNLRRLMESEEIERFQKGIYYKSKKTPFGKTKLNPNYIITDKYVTRDDQIFGYETDDTFLNKLELTTQIPKYKYIATNYYKNNGYQKNDILLTALRKPKTTITKENYKYLQMLDAIENRKKTSIDAINPNKVLHRYLKENNIDFGRLIAFAGKYYGEETLKGIAEIAQEELICE